MLELLSQIHKAIFLWFFRKFAIEWQALYFRLLPLRSALGLETDRGLHWLVYWTREMHRDRHWDREVMTPDGWITDLLNDGSGDCPTQRVFYYLHGQHLNLIELKPATQWATRLMSQECLSHSWTKLKCKLSKLLTSTSSEQTSKLKTVV